MFYSELYDRALKNPAEVADTLYIITGYTSSAMVFRHLTENPQIKVKMIVGMTPKDGISLQNHTALWKLCLETFLGRFSCMYNCGPIPIHIKAYAWFAGDVPVAGFIGSANYSQTAFWGNQMECLADSDPFAIRSLFYDLSRNCADITQGWIHKKVYIFQGDSVDHTRIKNSAKFRIDQKKNQEAVKAGMFKGARAGDGEAFSEYGIGESIEVTLLTQDRNRIHDRGGLNWGHRGGREKNQAYIPLSSEIYNTDFFPKTEVHFTMITDDGEVLNCVRAQENGKAIQTYESNSILGKYFRSRLGLREGAFVHKEDLEAYGRTSVKITKIDQETYIMDFSV